MIYRFNVILLRITRFVLVNIDELMLKFIWKGIVHRVDKTLLKKKTEVKRITLLVIKAYGRATVIVAVSFHWMDSHRLRTA